MEKVSRRTFTTKTIELVATLPLIGVVVDNFIKSRIYYEADISKATFVNNKESVKQFANIQEDFDKTLAQLISSYKKEYYKSHIQTYPSLDSQGNVTIKNRIVWDWEEPKSIPDHKVIYSWQNQQSDLASRAHFLISQPLVDKNKLEVITIDKKESNRTLQAVLSIVIYGAEIGLLLGYEEIIATVKYYESYQHRCISLSEKVEEMNTADQINRRNFFKIFAAFTAAGVAEKIRGYNAKRLEEGKSKLETTLENEKAIVARNKTHKDKYFQRYFQTNPKELIKNVNEEVFVAKEALEKGVKDVNVRNSFQSFVTKAEDYAKNLEEFFSNGVPQELELISECEHITRTLNKVTSQQKNYATTSVLLESLAVGGTLAAVLIPAEIINSKMS
ncbi:hypothetical protein J4225_00205 [Candidatus Pacearchaeota archaeon]|nr:hypothetical protein [Candidatus Pacearchaeota archaeon]